MENLVLVKLGGSLITDKTKPFYAREKIIRRLGREISEARKKGFKLIIGHGAGSFGHPVASKYKIQEGGSGKKFIKGISCVSEAAIDLNRIVIKNLIRQDLPVFPFSPSSFILSENRKEKEIFIEPIREALKIGLLPVVHGDIIIDTKRDSFIFSTERVLKILAQLFKKEYKNLRVIQCGDTDGVYDGEGKTIPTLKLADFKKIRGSLLKSRNVDVTGGMLHKVEESLKLAKDFGVNTIVINGKVRGNLGKALLGKKVKGTLITG